MHCRKDGLGLLWKTPSESGRRKRSTPLVRSGPRAPEKRHSPVRLRAARPADLPELVALEAACFSYDRISAEAFRHLLSRAHAINLVAEQGAHLLGYGTLLLRRGSRRARLYSLAVAQQARGQGLGRRLLAGLERGAKDRGCNELRMEAKTDNRAALALYQAQGWSVFGRYENYYQDGSPALRLCKTLGSAPQERR